MSLITDSNINWNGDGSGRGASTCTTGHPWTIAMVSGMVGKVAGGQPAEVLRVDVMVQVVSPPLQVPQTSTWTTGWRVRE